MERASWSKRSENFSLETLIATVRSSRVSRALYTSPIPPAPMGARTSWVPDVYRRRRAFLFLHQSRPVDHDGERLHAVFLGHGHQPPFAVRSNHAGHRSDLEITDIAQMAWNAHLLRTSPHIHCH